MGAVLAEREPYQDYSLERKAEVLAILQANDGNVLATAEETGVSRQTIQYWVANQTRFAEIQHRKQLDLAAKHENNLHRLTDSVTETDLNTVTFMQKVTAIGILTDKMLLLRGQPTSITEHVERQEVSVLLSSILNVEP